MGGVEGGEDQFKIKHCNLSLSSHVIDLQDWRSWHSFQTSTAKCLVCLLQTPSGTRSPWRLSPSRASRYSGLTGIYVISVYTLSLCFCMYFGVYSGPTCGVYWPQTQSHLLVSYYAVYMHVCAIYVDAYIIMTTLWKWTIPDKYWHASLIPSEMEPLAAKLSYTAWLGVQKGPLV